MHEWTPSDVVTIIAALSAFAVSVINALKNTQARVRAEDNQERINSLARHVQGHDQQLTTLALNIPSPGAGTPTDCAPAPAGSGGSASIDLVAPQGADAEEPR